MSFFSAPASRVCETILDWASETNGLKYTQYTPLPERWDQFLGVYITPDTTGILVPTQGEWCAFINNDRIGGMPSSELLVVPERLRIRSASFVLDDLQRRKKEQNPYAAMFKYCDATRGNRGEGAVERSVDVIWNGGGGSGGWEFREGGAPLPFEEVDAYKNRKKADRLTPEMLLRYARALGIYLDQGDSFFRLNDAIGLKWQWTKRSTEESTKTILGIADKINEEFPGKWTFNFFRKRGE